MPKFLFICSYSSGSWARMIRISDNRVEAGKSLVEALGGTLDSMFWEVSTRAVYAVADMPDPETAAAATAVLTHTGAFKNVESHQLLTQDQMSDVLELASSVADVYNAPGQALLDDDSSWSRFQSRNLANRLHRTGNRAGPTAYSVAGSVRGSSRRPAAGERA